jgi:hypothetical protein
MYTLTLNIKSKPEDKNGLQYVYGKKASRPLPKPVRPNGPLTGRFTVQPDGNTVAIFDAAKATIDRSFNGKLATSNKAQYSVTVGYTNSPHYYEIGITSPSGDTKKINPTRLQVQQWNFQDYKLGVLNQQTTRIALMGKTTDQISNLTLTPGFFAIGIMDLATMQLQGLLRLQSSSYVRPYFFTDGRLLYSGENGGINISSVDYSQEKEVYGNSINALALSPDEKTIAFSEGIFFYTMNIDGSNKKQLICGREPVSADKGDNVADLCFSPDGKYLGLCFRSGTQYKIAALPLDGSEYMILKDEDGEELAQYNPLLSWY